MVSGLTSLIVPTLSVLVIVLTVVFSWSANNPHGMTRRVSATTSSITVFIMFSFILMKLKKIACQGFYGFHNIIHGLVHSVTLRTAP
jgi:hypothetical protein